MPLTGKVDKAAVRRACRASNFIDDLVWKRLERSASCRRNRCDDATFLRRAHLDVIGRLPTPDEVRAFLADKAADKREQLVDALLERPEYADHWANKWADLLRPNPYRVGIKAVMTYDSWIRDAFRDEQAVRPIRSRDWSRLAAARSATARRCCSAIAASRTKMTTMVSQLFLGVRLDCAKCHHHPFEVWGQDDFYGTAAYFAASATRAPASRRRSPAAKSSSSPAPRGSVKHPLTGRRGPAEAAARRRDAVADGEDLRERVRPLDGRRADESVLRAGRRQSHVGRPDGARHRRAGRRPSGHESAVESGTARRAGREFPRGQKFDQKQLLRTILTSHVYELSSLPNERNAWDAKNYSRHYRQRLRAETLLDAVCDITGVARDVRRRCRRIAGRRDLDAPRRQLVPRLVRPARPEPGSAVRANAPTRRSCRRCT